MPRTRTAPCPDAALDRPHALFGAGSAGRRALVLATGGLAVVATALCGATAAGAAGHSAPKVSSLSAHDGGVDGGARVTVHGAGFTHVTKVLFGSAKARMIGNPNSHTLVVRTPAHRAGSVEVEVVTKDGRSHGGKHNGFAYVAAPTVAKLTPASGTAGTRVTVVGSGFVHQPSVRFGSRPATGVRVLSATRLSVVAPSKVSGTVPVVVRTAYGTSPTSSAHFTYGSAPKVTDIYPIDGTSAGGTTVFVSGNGFTKHSVVRFGGTPGTDVTIVGPHQLTVVSPRHTDGHVMITVTNSGGTSAGNPNAGYVFETPPSAPACVFNPARTMNRVAIEWTASHGAHSYEIRRTKGAVAASGPNQGLYIGDFPASTTSYTDDSVHRGTTYTYAVFARTGRNGWSAKAGAVTLTVPRKGDLSVPSGLGITSADPTSGSGGCAATPALASARASRLVASVSATDPSASVQGLFALVDTRTGTSVLVPGSALSRAVHGAGRAAVKLPASTLIRGHEYQLTVVAVQGTTTSATSAPYWFRVTD